MQNIQLAQIVEQAQSNLQSFSIIRRHAVGILVSLGMDYLRADQWLMRHVRNKLIPDLAAWERELNGQLSQCGVYERLPLKMQERAEEWFDKIEPYLVPGTTLDLGGGSGEVANLMQTAGCSVTIADVLNWSKYNFPFVPVRANHIDASSASFDQVVLLTVFHHTNEPEALVHEAFRLAKRRVIFIESVTENLIGYMYGAWIDWFYNRVIHYSDTMQDKINVPCNFLPASGWEQMVWKSVGLRPTYSINLGIYQELNPENHHLFVYDC